ncbi:MAG: 4Fe-4S dicluster domain-containing protein [Prevotellaceae bacterium]|jgi:heterodisulfide reductase subunit C|nr:4Fe-4S dicluster domain-containing protein [Prevotellaceae bacterium]
MNNHLHHEERGLAADVKQTTSVAAEKCYQCGKCSAGCPVASEMDLPPSLVMRMLQTNRPENDEKLLRSKTIWLCLSCEMCISRCPMSIDIPKVMDFLRRRSRDEGKVTDRAKDIVAFHDSFLLSVEKTGKLYELGLIAAYKMKTLHLMQDVTVAPEMIQKGKLHFIPEMVKNRKNIAQIFKKTIKAKN